MIYIPIKVEFVFIICIRITQQTFILILYQAFYVDIAACIMSLAQIYCDVNHLRYTDTVW